MGVLIALILCWWAIALTVIFFCISAIRNRQGYLSIADFILAGAAFFFGPIGVLSLVLITVWNVRFLEKE